jgi:uncharacterized protein involved in response to NO
MAFWLASLFGVIELSTSWHGHEMLFGFGTAALSGFMMAAVPKWTNANPVQGMPLAVLILLWLFGRVAIFTETYVWLDLLHLPFLAFLVGRMIYGAGNKRNYIVPAMVLMLAGLNGLYHYFDPSLALRAGACLLPAFLVLIGGRVVPAFTQNALRMTLAKNITCTTPAWTERLALPSVLLVVILELVAAETAFTGAAAILAASVLLIRMLGWQSLKTLSIPLVWILHVGYAWLPLGFALKGLADLGVLENTFAAMHALTTGAVGVMVLAMGSRAALGHSGRPLIATKPTILVYFLVIGAAVLRVFLPFDWALPAAGLLWTAGWGLFAVTYWPVLARPRIDGLPG